MKKFIILLLFLNSINYSFCQENNLEKDTIFLKKIDLISNKIETTYATTKKNVNINNLNKKNLGQDIPSLLKYEPSMIFNSDAGNGIGYSSLKLRGSDQTRINVTINGVPLNDSESQQVYYVDIPDLFSSASSIQIQRGVGVSTVGNGSFGGQIDISTMSLNKNPYGTIEYSHGSFNTSKRSVGFGSGLIKKKIAFDGRVSHIKSNGYIDRAESDLKSYYFSSQYNSKKTLIQLISFGGIEETYQAWYGVPISYLNRKNLRTFNPYSYENQIDHYEQIHHQAHLHHSFNDKLKISSTFHYTHGEGYYESLDNGYNNDGVEIGNYIDAFSYLINSEDKVDIVNQKWLDNDYYGFIMKTDYQNKNFSNISGLSLNKYDGNHFGKIVSINDDNYNKENKFEYNSVPISDYYRNLGNKISGNIYSRSTLNLGSLSLCADLQIQKINYKIKGTTDDQIEFNNRYFDNKWDYTFFNPKFGITYIKNNNHKVFGSFSVGNSAPNRFDLINNPNPKAERLYNTEIQYLFKSNQFLISTGLYYMDYKDQLVLTGELNDVGATIRTNVDKSYRLGLEVISEINFDPIIWSFNLNMSDNKIDSFNEYIDNWNTGEQEVTEHQKTTIAFSPNLIASSSINWEIFKNNYMSCNLNFDSKYVSRQFLDNTNNVDRELPGYSAHDLSLLVNLKKDNSKELKVKFHVKNLFNSLYSSFGWTYPFISAEDYVNFSDPYLVIEEDDDEVYNGTQIYNQTGVYPQATRNYMLGIELNF